MRVLMQAVPGGGVAAPSSGSTASSPALSGSLPKGSPPSGHGTLPWRGIPRGLPKSLLDSSDQTVRHGMCHRTEYGGEGLGAATWAGALFCATGQALNAAAVAGKEPATTGR